MNLARTAALLGLSASVMPACAPPPTGAGARPAAGKTAGPSIRWTVEPSGRATVSVVGVNPGALATLRSAKWDAPRWGDLLSVDPRRPGPPKADLPKMLGSHGVEGAEIRFRTLYPLDYGVRYRATFHPGRLPGSPAKGAPDVAADLVRSAPPTDPVVVSRIDPAGGLLPENLLKFYVHFSGPMSRGSAYEHVEILDESGKPADLPFLEVGEELWDDSMTRLTLLLDPGRIKRGLKPREESGPILESGHSYTLVVAADWPDSFNRPLEEGFRKAFRAGPPDEAQPDPRSWTITPPRPGTIGPLVVRSPEPLDRAMLERSLRVVDDRGRPVSGGASIDADSAGWRFTPMHSWNQGDYRLLVATDLEDLAGNSVGRPFEVDATRPVEDRAAEAAIAIDFRISGGKR